MQIKKRQVVNENSLAVIGNNLKKISVVAFLISSFFLKAQSTSTYTCTAFKLTTDLTHYNVSSTTHDSTFAKYIQFNLSDTVTVAKITYTLSNVTTSSQVQLQNYTVSTIPSTQNLTVANNCQRNQKNVKISLGYFTYSGTKYLVNIKLYGTTNNLLNSSNFNFNH